MEWMRKEQFYSCEVNFWSERLIMRIMQTYEVSTLWDDELGSIPTQWFYSVDRVKRSPTFATDTIIKVCSSVRNYNWDILPPNLSKQKDSNNHNNKMFVSVTSIPL
jgi:hypothetical protein